MSKRPYPTKQHPRPKKSYQGKYIKGHVKYLTRRSPK